VILCQIVFAADSLSEVRDGVRMAMGETDVTLRRLLRGLPRPILRLAFPRRRLGPLGPLAPSVHRPRQRTADGCSGSATEPSKAAVHVEIERAWRAELPRRLFEDASAAAVATRLPVSSVVFLLRPGNRTAGDADRDRLRRPPPENTNRGAIAGSAVRSVAGA
jgi:hypothetical protein